MTLTPDEQAQLGPRTCAYLSIDHGAHNCYRLSWLAVLVLAERQGHEPRLELPTGWNSGPLALLLGNVLDYLKAGKLTEERAEQYRKEGREAVSPGKLLRLLVTLHFETNPQT